jgi:tryptophan-rich sensory protein
MNKYISLAVFFVLTAAAAAFGARYMPGAWYEALTKPSFNPPNWIFGPVWTVLYIMIALAGWRVWESGQRGTALAIWVIALALNGAWSFIFFGLQRTGLALADIIALLIAITAFIALTWRHTRSAALLFLPYLAWVAFATVLNYEIWRLNG